MNWNGGTCTNKKDIYGGWNEYSLKGKNHENGYQKDSNLDLSHKKHEFVFLTVLRSRYWERRLNKVWNTFNRRNRNGYQTEIIG